MKSSILRTQTNVVKRKVNYHNYSVVRVGFRNTVMCIYNMFTTLYLFILYLLI